MSIELITNASSVRSLPAGTDGIDVTLNASSWANSSYHEIVASADKDYVLLGVTMGTSTANLLRVAEIDIAIGGAGSETVIATAISGQGNVDNARGLTHLTIPIDRISTGDRVSCRIRKNDTSTGTMRIGLVVAGKPLGSEITTTTNASKSYPASGVVSSFAPVTEWANSSWTQIVASTSDAIVLGGVMLLTTNTGMTMFEVDIGVGAVSSETVVTTVRSASMVGPSAVFPMRPVLDNIPAGSRISFRIRGTGGAFSHTVYVKLLYYDKTGIGDISNISTTLPLKWFPSAASNIQVPHVASSWTDGPWTEFSSALTTSIQVAVLQFEATVGPDREIDFGIGAGGSETVVHTVRVSHTSGTRKAGQMWHTFPYLLSGFTTGNRLALRARGESANTTGIFTAIGYYEGATTPIAVNRARAYPEAANAVTVTPSATPWANSSWVQLVGSMPRDGQIGYLCYISNIGDTEVEVDIGVGAASAEAVVQTWRVNTDGTGAGDGSRYIYIPLPYHLSEGDRVAVRMRKSGTDTQNWFWSATVYTEDNPGEIEFDPSDDIAGNTIGLVWVEFALEEGA